jgi:anti-sigma B factor antagonist
VAANPVVPSSDLHLSVEKKSGETVVRASGKIVSTASELLQKTIRGLLPETKHVVLDLTEVPYVDSSGIGALVSVYLAATRAECVLEIANPQPRIRDLFELSRLTAVFESRATYQNPKPE